MNLELREEIPGIADGKQQIMQTASMQLRSKAGQGVRQLSGKRESSLSYAEWDVLHDTQGMPSAIC